MRKTFVIAILITVSSVMAEDITTLKGETFNKVTVTRVEPDGIVVKHTVGVSKILFSDLPKEWQDRYRYEALKDAPAPINGPQWLQALSSIDDAEIQRRTQAHAKAAAASGEAFQRESLFNAKAHHMVKATGLPWNSRTYEAAYEAANAEGATSEHAGNEGRSPEGFDSKVQASWQKVYQAYPSVQDASTELANRIQASIEATSQSNPNSFRDPEWPFKITKSVVDQMNKETSGARSARSAQIDRDLRQIEIQIESWRHGAEVLGGRFPVRKDYQSKYHPREEVQKLEARAAELRKERDELAHGVR